MATLTRTATLLILASLSLLGCTKYYEVIDEESGEVYYTAARDAPERNHGAIKFRDSMTGEKVTLENAQVNEIKAIEYDYHVYKYGAKTTED